MGKLLHSKTFRGNLIKWLILYFLTILIVVGVVTYSKYISSMYGDDTARVARFNIQIENAKMCSTLSELCNDEETTNITTLKPYDTIDYSFTVDTTEVEVLTYLLLTITVDNNFEIESIKAGGEEVTADLSNNPVHLTSYVGPNKTNTTDYVIKLKYKNPNQTETKSIDNLITVGYSATQQN